MMIQPGNQWCSKDYYADLAKILDAESDRICRDHGIDRKTAINMIAQGYSHLVLLNACPAGNA
jgi:hypothetical protein